MPEATGTSTQTDFLGCTKAAIRLTFEVMNCLKCGTLPTRLVVSNACIHLSLSHRLRARPCMDGRGAGGQDICLLSNPYRQSDHRARDWRRRRRRPKKGRLFQAAHEPDCHCSAALTTREYRSAKG